MSHRYYAHRLALCTLKDLQASVALLQSGCSSPAGQSWNSLVPCSTEPVRPLSALVIDRADLF